jgi:hypothetical protein
MNQAEPCDFRREERAASPAALSSGTLDVQRLSRALLVNVVWDSDISRFSLYEDDGPDVLAEKIAIEYARLTEQEDTRSDR